MGKRESFWRSHIEKAISSKESKIKYIDNNGLSEKLFYYWQRKLYGKYAFRKKTAKKTAGKFLPVKVKEKQILPGAVKIGLPCGVVLEGSSYPDPSWLAKVVYSLAGRQQ